MQNYYGMAIRQNSLAHWNNDKEKALYAMKKSVLAVLWHCTHLENNDERHKFCPRDTDSWCKYWQKNDTSYKSSVNLPIAIKNKIQPIFMSLRNDELLSRCLDGTTQNPNEAFNQIIWQKCPKSVFVTKKVLDIGVASAVINYNDGLRGFENLFSFLKVPFGCYTAEGALKKDHSRVINMNKKSQTNQKTIRKKIRAVRKGFIDKEKETEGGDSYSAGNFLTLYIYYFLFLIFCNIEFLRYA